MSISLSFNFLQVFNFIILFLSINPICVYCTEDVNLTDVRNHSTITAVLSKPFKLVCPNISNGDISLILWNFNNLNVPSQMNSNQIKHPSSKTDTWYDSGNGTISIGKIRYEDALLYTCTAYNTKKLYSHYIKLIVVGPPFNVFNFNAISDRYKELKFTWNINNSVSNTVQKFNLTLCEGSISNKCDIVTIMYPIMQYTFKRLKSFWNYTASIIAINKYGNSERVDTYVKTSPGKHTVKPHIVKGIAGRNNVTLFIQCIKCFDQFLMEGTFSNYSVTFKDRANVTRNIIKKVNQTQVNITISKLKANFLYSFSVRVSNQLYYGLDDSTKLRTLPTKPRQPIFMRETSITSNSISIRWQHASNENGRVEEYFLRVMNSQSSSKNNTVFEKAINKDVNEYDITNLKPNTVYKIELATINVVGRGPFLSQVYKTDHPKPLAPALLSIKKFGQWVIVEWMDRNISNKSFTTNSTELKDEIRIEVCWKKKNNPFSNFECLIAAGYNEFSVDLTITNRDTKDFWCNSTNLRCSLSILTSTFDFNKTYTLFVKASIKSNRCVSGVSCHSISSRSAEKDFSIKDPNYNSLERIFNRNQYLIFGLAISLFFALLIAFITCIVCKIRNRNMCPPPNMILYPHVNGEYIEIYAHQSIPNIIPLEKSPHSPIPVSNLMEHIFRYRADDGAGFQAEFEAIECLEDGRFKTYSAKAKENAIKNRYTNVFPYDHSRVILQNPANGKSDYINASYVDGYHRPKAYIATQGPLKETIADFWQMVWEQNSEIIVMISNFVERGRNKCEEYWDSKEVVYGHISVRLVYENPMAFFTERRFRIKNVKNKKSSNKDRIVYHYQYTDWRDFDVPPSSLPVLVFIRASICHWSDRSGPIIVHCSAGVGRTGTYICIDSQIRQMESEHQVNIRGFLEHIRQQRMKLVQTESQYTFIHDALNEYFLCPDHDVHKDDFSTFIQRLKEIDVVSGLRKMDIQYKMCIQFEPSEYELMEARCKINVPKNRSEILPINSRRVNLSCEPGVEGSNYINASIVQGYWDMREYIVTQHPLEHTEQDFWKMVWDENCSMIILLSDVGDVGHNSDSSANNNNESGPDVTQTRSRLPKFWPESESESRSFRGGMKVGYRSHTTDYDSGCTSYDFMMCSSVEDYAQNVTMHWLKKWPDLVPKSSSQNTGNDDLRDIQDYSQLMRLLMITQSYVNGSNIASSPIITNHCSNPLNLLMSTSVTNGPVTHNDHHTNSNIETAPISAPITGEVNDDVIFDTPFSAAQLPSSPSSPIEPHNSHPPPGLTFISYPLINNGVGGGVNNGGMNINRNNNSKTGRGPVIVIDECGGSRAGIFVATSHLLSQLRQDDSLDVYFVVKMLHFERPNVFQDSSDLESIYNLLQYTIEHPSSYNIIPRRLDNAGNFMNGGINHHQSHHHPGNKHHNSHNNCIPVAPSNSSPMATVPITMQSSSLAGHYATLSSNPGPHTNTTLSTTHRSSRLSSLSSSLSRRHRASSAESQLFLQQQMNQQQQPQLQNHASTTTTHGNPVAMANYYNNQRHSMLLSPGSRASWNIEESKLAEIPFLSNNDSDHHQQQPQLQIISNPNNNNNNTSSNNSNNNNISSNNSNNNHSETIDPLMLASTTSSSLHNNTTTNNDDVDDIEDDISTKLLLNNTTQPSVQYTNPNPNHSSTSPPTQTAIIPNSNSTHVLDQSDFTTESSII